MGWSGEVERAGGGSRSSTVAWMEGGIVVSLGVLRCVYVMVMGAEVWTFPLSLPPRDGMLHLPLGIYLTM
jgi:hypothetical protein